MESLSNQTFKLNLLEPISKFPLRIIGSFVVIPAEAGIQCFRAFLDARFRGHDGFLTKNEF